MTPDITSCMLEVQDRVTNTLNKVQHQSTIDRYMNDLKTCIANNVEEFNSWLLSVEKVLALRNSIPKESCFKKVEGNLLKFLYPFNLNRCSWFTLKERMRAKFLGYQH